MSRRRADIEIIDVLDPEDDSVDWGVVQAGAPPRPPSRPLVLRAPRSRWPWVIGALAVVVAIVVTLVVTRDRPAPKESAAAGRYVLVDSRLSNYSTDIATPFDDTGAFRVWAAGGPTEPHVEIQVDTDARDPFVTVDGSLRDVGGIDLIDTLGTPDRVTVVRDLGGNARMVIRATGLSDDDVTAIADVPPAVVGSITIGVSADRIADLVMTADVQQRLGLEQVVAARWGDEALYGHVETAMRYLDEQANVVMLRVAKGSLADQVTALGYLSDEEPAERGDRHVGRLATTGDAVVLWQRDGYVLSLTGPGDPERYVDLSRAVRAVTATEWDRQLIFLRPDYRVGEFAALGHGADWTAGVQRAERGGATKLLWWFTVPSKSGVSTSVPVRFEPTVEPFADRIVVDGVTYVFVSAPATSGVTDATVFYGDSGVEQLTLTQPFADVPVVMAAVRIDAPVPVRVRSPGIVEP